MKQEGVKVFQQSYRGKLFFFLKKNSENSSLNAKPSQPKPKPKPIEWNEKTIQEIKHMREQGYSFPKIAEIFQRRGFQINKGTLRVKFWMLTKNQKQQNIEKVENANCEPDNLFFELVEASKILYPKFKNACALLLREASKRIEKE